MLERWLPRGLLAALCLLASEILLWNNPSGRDPLSWLLLAAGYLALAALLLDLAARYRIRDLFALLALVGVYGLLNSLLLNPETTLAGVPRTWATRVLGAQTLFGLISLLLLIRPRYQIPLAAVAGFLWGVWVDGLPSVSDIVQESVLLPMMLLTAAMLLAIVLTLWWLAARHHPRLDALQLQPLEGVGVAVILLLMLILNFQHIDPISLIVLPVLLGYCLLLLWFQRRDEGRTLFDTTLNFEPQNLAAALLFLVAGALGHSLHLALSPLLAGGFAAFGLVWLPTISLVLGVRSYRRMGRQQRL